MSVEAPERIWAFEDGDGVPRGGYWCEEQSECPTGSPEYVRADKLEELAAEVERLTSSRDGYAKHSIARGQECDRLQTALAEKDKEIAEATTYAENLASDLYSQHYAENTSWRPMSGDLTGLLTQIDNMTAGLARNAGGKDADR